MALTLATRTQFTFVSTQRKLAELLTLNVASTPTSPVPAAPRTIVNIVGQFSVEYPVSKADGKTEKKKAKSDKSECKNDADAQQLLLTKIVVGTDDPNNIALGGAGNPLSPDPLRSNELQNRQFRLNLQALGIPYTEQIVIQIFNSVQTAGVAGIYRVYFSALTCAGIKMLAFYSGEETLVNPLTPIFGAGVPAGSFLNQGIGVFIEVPPAQLADAVRVLSDLPLVSASGAPFDESILCINTRTVTDLISSGAVISRTKPDCKRCGRQSRK